MKVIYCVSELLDWIDIAKYFDDSKNWTPLFWLTTQKNHNYANKIFPNIETIDFYQANRGNFTDISSQEIAIEPSIISKYLKYEKITLKMMDRMDSTGYHFNYSERTQLYYVILEFILNYFLNNKPNLIIFNESPHSIFTYLIYAVAKEENIKILRISPTHINANTFLTGTLETQQSFFNDTYNHIVKNKILDNEVINYIETINGRYENATPYYMDKIISSNKENNFFKIAKSSLRALKYSFRLKERNSYLKNEKESIKSSFSNLTYAKSLIKSTLFKIKLQKEYAQYVKQSSAYFNLEDSFIYVPLQYQPEKSTSPEGDIFVDQYLAINMLSKLSKGKFKIYVKEHISQFSPKLKGEQGRLLSFYQELSLLQNIVFVDTDISSFTLIDKSIAVSTITGTAGFESVIRGKASIIFGYPWYKNCHGVFHISNTEQLKDVLNKIEKNYQVKIEYVQYFLQTIFSISEKIYLNNSNKSSIKDKKHNNAQAIINLLEKYESQIHL